MSEPQNSGEQFSGNIVGVVMIVIIILIICLALGGCLWIISIQ